MHRLKIATGVLLYSIFISTSGAQVDIDSSTKIVIGSANSRTGEVLLDFEPNRKFKYQILNKTGGSLFQGAIAKCEIYNPSENLVVKQWKLMPIENIHPGNLPRFPIVVISTNERSYYQVNQLTDAVTSESIEKYIKSIRFPSDYPPVFKRYSYYGAGTKNHTTRILLIVENEEIEIKGLNKITISILDVGSDKVIKELFTYFKRAGDSDFFANYISEADLNHDELADIFVISHGDFYGHSVLIQSGNKWRVETTTAHGD